MLYFPFLTFTVELPITCIYATTTPNTSWLHTHILFHIFNIWQIEIKIRLPDISKFKVLSMSNKSYSFKVDFKQQIFKKRFHENFILRLEFYPPLEQKLVQHGPKTITIGCNNDLCLLIFEEKWPSYASGPKSAPNSGLFWVHQLFNVCVRVFCAPNATILLVYLPAKIKMSFIWKDDFFFQNRHLPYVYRRPT